MLVDSFAEGAAAVARGAAAALLADTDAAAVAGLQRLAALPPLASSSYHLVTQNVRSPLSARLAAALAALAAGGAEARLLAYERATYGAAGVPPCHALLELSADPNVTGAGVGGRRLGWRAALHAQAGRVPAPAPCLPQQPCPQPLPSCAQAP